VNLGQECLFSAAVIAAAVIAAAAIAAAIILIAHATDVKVRGVWIDAGEAIATVLCTEEFRPIYTSAWATVAAIVITSRDVVGSSPFALKVTEPVTDPI
jgi:hypothetical protein